MLRFFIWTSVNQLTKKIIINRRLLLINFMKIYARKHTHIHDPFLFFYSMVANLDRFYQTKYEKITTKNLFNCTPFSFALTFFLLFSKLWASIKHNWVNDVHSTKRKLHKIRSNRLICKIERKKLVDKMCNVCCKFYLYILWSVVCWWH